MMGVNLQQDLFHSLLDNGNRTAFYSEGAGYTYSQLLKDASSIACHLERHNCHFLGIIANQDFGTYAAIVAALVSGVTYVPLEPSHPQERNDQVISIAGLQHIFCSDPGMLPEGFITLHGEKIFTTPVGEAHSPTLAVNITGKPAYILFTSGTTGIPKGVPISTGNLEAFVGNVNNLNMGIHPGSRFLQAFDLTFDLSVFSYLVPLLSGSSVYLLPKTPLRYTLAVEIIEEHHLTHVLTVPSFVQFLKPYYREILLPSVQYWLFCGEALKTELVEAWQPCIPKAAVYNVYGPTEATIFCSSYFCSLSGIKDVNGIVSIGKPFKGTYFFMAPVDENPDSSAVSAELCIGGEQLTTGYLNDPGKNVQSFFLSDSVRFYRSGDICLSDSDGDYFFLGRKDTQVKIQGYRIELSELEYQARQIDGVEESVVVVSPDSESSQPLLYLFFSSRIACSAEEIRERLSDRLPSYMMPAQCVRLEVFPLNSNGKTDRRALQEMIRQINSQK